jgi:hypothetical protein
MTRSKQETILAVLAAREIDLKLSILEGDYDLPLAAAIALTDLEVDGPVTTWSDGVERMYRAGYAFDA